MNDFVGGSSPRMRGAPVHDLSGPASGRIIPADAGSTCWRTGPAHGARDHPRGCGEHNAPFDDTDAQQGSSPRMRGAPVRP